jgi:hypothetical protein
MSEFIDHSLLRGKVVPSMMLAIVRTRWRRVLVDLRSCVYEDGASDFTYKIALFLAVFAYDMVLVIAVFSL